MEIERIKDLFLMRGKSQGSHALWTAASLDSLEAAHDQSGGNLDTAAEKLISAGWDAESLNYLAYAGFCFWHLPIGHLINDNVGRDRHWAGNFALGKLLTSPPSISRNAVLNDVNHRLDLASLAFKARNQSATAYLKFQDDLFLEVCANIVDDERLASIGHQWPQIHAENGKHDPDRAPNGIIIPSLVEKIQALDPQALAGLFPKIVVEAAQNIDARTFGDLPPIKPNIFVGSKTPNAPTSGCYFFATPQRPYSGYHFDCENDFSFDSFPRFIASNIHESLHILQHHITMKNNGDHSGLFVCEALCVDDNRCKDDFDLPRCTYSPRVRSPLAQSAMQAYVSRPTEFFTHSFDYAIESFLCKAWGISQGRRIYEPDVSRLLNLAQTQKVTPQRPNEIAHHPDKPCRNTPP